jgi:hypothetical protein
MTSVYEYLPAARGPKIMVSRRILIRGNFKEKRLRLSLCRHRGGDA